MPGSKRTRGRRVRWYGLVYRAAYLLGLTVWDRRAPAGDLVDLVEGSDPPRPGRALDLGCGAGTDSVYLAQHGWEVTGIDMVPRALAVARRRAAAAGVSPRYIRGDVTRLDELGIGEDFSLVLDFGCFHTLPDDRREPYVASVSGVAAPGAVMLLFGFARPPRLAPLHAGLTPDEVRDRFGPKGWVLVRADRAPAGTIDASGRRVDERFELWRCRLVRSMAAETARAAPR
jgi:SAM-dependent methyltransferase